MAIDPPWRLDPFQNIVNVSWRGAGQFLVGGAANAGNSDTPPSPAFAWQFTEKGELVRPFVNAAQGYAAGALDSGNNPAVTDFQGNVTRYNKKGIAFITAGGEANAFDGGGNLFVAGSNVWFKLDQNGETVASGTSASPFIVPGCVCCDGDGSLFIVSLTRGSTVTIQKISFSPKIASWVSAVPGGNALPASGLGCDSKGNVWVGIDLVNNDFSGTMMAYGFDGRTGGPVGSISIGAGAGLSFWGFDVDGNDNVIAGYTTSSSNTSVASFSTKGKGSWSASIVFNDPVNGRIQANRIFVAGTKKAVIASGYAGPASQHNGDDNFTELTYSTTNFYDAETGGQLASFPGLFTQPNTDESPNFQTGIFYLPFFAARTVR
jgi:hypothetical protein